MVGSTPVILPVMLIGQSSVPPAPAAPHRDRFDATVVVNTQLCTEHYRLRLALAAPFPATAPGQFIQLGCRTPDQAADVEALRGADTQWTPDAPPQLQQPELCGRLALLRRPFSLAGQGPLPDGGTWLEVIHRVVGTGTDWLSRLQPGDAVDLIGPLGNAFTLPRGKSLGLLVGGGVGLPPMFYLAQALQSQGWDAIAFVGALRQDLLPVQWSQHHPPATDGSPVLCVTGFADCGYRTVVTTDDGSRGLPGRITDGLAKVLNRLSVGDRARAVVYTCGPEPMMHAVAQLAQRCAIDCQVCLEQAMACGMGTCQSCVVRIEAAGQAQHGVSSDGQPWRYRLACTDGPVFDARKVVWRV